jgi:hypothetical protein
MPGPSHTLGSPWPTLEIRPCFVPINPTPVGIERLESASLQLFITLIYLRLLAQGKGTGCGHRAKKVRAKQIVKIKLDNTGERNKKNI